MWLGLPEDFFRTFGWGQVCQRTFPEDFFRTFKKIQGSIELSAEMANIIQGELYFGFGDLHGDDDV